MCSDSEKNMSAFADQNHAPSLTCVRLECMGEFNMNDGQKLPVNVSLAQSFKKLFTCQLLKTLYLWHRV